MEKTNISEELLLYTDVLPINVQIVSIGGVDKKHDKAFKNILSEVSEMAKFLSQYLGLEVEEENLEKYKNSFITRETSLVRRCNNKLFTRHVRKSR